MPKLDALKILLENASGKYFDPAAMVNRKNGYYVEMVRTITPKDLLPGVETLLTILRIAGIKVGVASSSKNTKAVIRLGGRISTVSLCQPDILT